MISSKGQFVVRLPKDRADALAASGAGERFQPRPGRPMKEWVVLLDQNANWLELAAEACRFVAHSKP